MNNKNVNKKIRKNNNRSIMISKILGGIFFVVIAVSCFLVPMFVDALIQMPDNMGFRNEATALGRAFMIGDIYFMMAIGEIAIILMFVLLNHVSAGNVFSKKTGKLLNGVSMCCFVEGIFSLLLLHYFQLIICASLAAFFLGLCLLVVKNVINEATAIKEENDFTV